MSTPITLITDSSACIPADSVRALGISVVPILVTIENEQYPEGVEPNVLYEALERGRAVKSAAPTPVDYLDAIERAPDGPVVVLTPAAEFTHMHRNARLAADMSERPVTVVDSRTATAGHGLVALAAAEVAADGVVDDVVAAAEDAGRRAELVACLESLEYLRQSGHVPAIALGLANHLQVRPVFRMRGGTAERIGLPRSERSALERIAKAWRDGSGPRAPQPAVFHAGRPERAEELAAMVGGAAFVTEFSAAMAIHTGPGVVGAAWLRPPEDPGAVSSA